MQVDLLTSPVRRSCRRSGRRSDPEQRASLKRRRTLPGMVGPTGRARAPGWSSTQTVGRRRVNVTGCASTCVKSPTTSVCRPRRSGPRPYRGELPAVAVKANGTYWPPCRGRRSGPARPRRSPPVADHRWVDEGRHPRRGRRPPPPRRSAARPDPRAEHDVTAHVATARPRSTWQRHRQHQTTSRRSRQPPHEPGPHDTGYDARAMRPLRFRRSSKPASRRHAVQEADRRLRQHVRGAGKDVPRGSARGAVAAHADRDARHRAPLAPGHLAQLRLISTIRRRRPTIGSSRSSCSEREHRAADPARLPGHRHRDHHGKRGQYVSPAGGDEAAIARGVFDTYAEDNLRYSQVAPRHVREKNTGNNLPAQIELYATDGDEYHFLFMAKGGGSANKSLLFQETKALLNPKSLAAFLDQKLRSLAPPPVRRTTSRCDRRDQRRTDAQGREARVGALPRRATDHRERARPGVPRSRVGAEGRRDRAEQPASARSSAAILLSRRPRDPVAAPWCELPGRARGVVLGRSPGARQDHARGVFLEQLETDPAKYLPEPTEGELAGEVVKIDLTQPMNEIRATLSRYPIKTRCR